MLKRKFGEACDDTHTWPDRIRTRTFDHATHDRLCERSVKYATCKIITAQCANPGRHDYVATRVRAVAANICGSSVWTLLQITLLGTRISEVGPRFM
jgi:hypothetical protein